ncbi:unnamed protein product [Orchesella dallaii]|uniref:ascorbate ferrireductase (transmembrane) n=1 Tax=Orchesella dallaii TaxID=48710 RepID=A0ABP1PSR8_9HEXA
MSTNFSRRQCTVPDLPKNHACRCYHRPTTQGVSFINSSSFRNFYDIVAVDISPDYVSDPSTENSICVFFGHSSTAPKTLITDDFVLQAVNEYGWPIGLIELTAFDDICVPPPDSEIRRDRLDSITFFRHFEDPTVQCYRSATGMEEEMHSLPNTIQNKLPGLLNFYNPLTRKSVGVTALVRLHHGYRPTKIKFMAEAFINYTTAVQNKMIRVFSDTYEVTYNPTTNKADGVVPSPDDTFLDFGYSYQIKDFTKCIPPKPIIPEVPLYKEFLCTCYLQARIPHLETFPGTTHTALFPRIMNVTQVVEQWGPNVAPEVIDFNAKAAPNDFSIEYDPTHNLLIVIYPFMPVYKKREWTTREVVLQALADNGLPLGTWLSPWTSSDRDIYHEACQTVFASKNLKYTKPPFPAVGDCVPDNETIITIPPERYTEKSSKACYFHFHSQYFYLDCVGECETPKYICAAWKYEEASKTPVPTIPFDFQFIAHVLYYQNVAVQDNTGLPPQSAFSCTSLSTPLQDWYVMETHPQNNRAFLRRSAVWRYTGKLSQLFREIGESNEDSDSIMHKEYQSLIVGPPELPEDKCVEPATYYLETKDNNICLCTFWGDNIGTWQGHYGRPSSCVKSVNDSFSKYFKIEVFDERMTKDTIIVRVYTEPTTVLVDRYVLHAVYINALDQYGIPVGKWDKGYWKNPGAVIPDKCAEDRYPPENDPVIKKHPVFDVDHCPLHPQIPELGISATDEKAELFIYKNLWRDGERYSEICGKFHFPPPTKANYPHVTHIQFVAFIRLEDIGGERQAYMLEVRSNIVKADNFLDHPTSSIIIDPPPPGIEGATLKPPLNYRYYKHSIMLSTHGWEREECVAPPREPQRIFDLCRHYITTEPVNEMENKDDLDLEMDKYFHHCKLWTAHVYRYGENHLRTQQLWGKMPGFKANADEKKLWKSCFSLEAYPHRIVNSYHVAFRVLENVSEFCNNNMSKKFVKEVSILALNEDGYPVGRKWARGFGSFKLFNHFFAAGKPLEEFCDYDDIKLNLDEKIFENKMVHDDLLSKCIFDQSTPYPLDQKKFHQDYAGDVDVPSLMIWANFGLDKRGFCANWYYGNLSQPGVTAPRRIQFIASVHVLGGKGDGTKQGTPMWGADHILTIRSPKYIFEHNKNYFPGQTTSHGCHNSSKYLQVDTTGKPDDNCECTIERISNPNGPPPLCALLYDNFHHILDKSLYRVCLSVEDPSRGVEDFAADDCRTKIEYPMPPVVYEPELIQLTVDGQDNYTTNDTVGVGDPVNEAFEACGLIKQCYSRYSDDEVDRSCIQDRSCDILVTFGKGLGEGPGSGETVVEIYAVARGWAAVGISPEDETMSEDYVIECVKEGPAVHIYNSWNVLANQGNRTPNKTNYRMRDENGIKHNIRPVKSLFYHDKLYCKFYIKTQFTKTDPDLKMEHEYDLRKKYYNILAFSDELPDKFGEEHGNIKTHLPSQVSEKGRKITVLSERLSPVPYQAKLIRLHGVFMTFSWLLFVTLSTFIARYYKETLTKMRIMNLSFWYFFHVSTVSLGFLCLIIGIILEIQATAGWKNVYRSNFHTYSGIVSICLYTAEVIMGIWVKRIGEHAADRKLLSTLHSIFGHLAYNIALLNMAFSGRVSFSFLACNFQIYIWVWLAVYYLLHCLMSYHYCWVDFILGRTGSTYGPRQIVLQRRATKTSAIKDVGVRRHSLRRSRKIAELELRRLGKIEDQEIEAPGKYIRVAALILFVVITSVYTFWTLRKLLTYPRRCYSFRKLKALEDVLFT